MSDNFDQSPPPSLFGDELNERFAARRSRLRDRKKNHRLLFQASVAMSLLIILAAFRIDIRPKKELNYEPAAQEVVVLEDIQQTRQVAAPPPPPAPPLPIQVPDDAVLEDEVLVFDSEIDFAEPADLPPPPPPVRRVAQMVEEEPELEIFMVVEEMPELIGGLGRLMETVEYPELARRAGVEGTVVVQIIINSEGVPTEPVVLRSVNNLLDQEAIDAVMEQRFTPGKQRGRAVPVRISVPIQFRLTAA